MSYYHIDLKSHEDRLHLHGERRIWGSFQCPYIDICGNGKCFFKRNVGWDSEKLYYDPAVVHWPNIKAAMGTNCMHLICYDMQPTDKALE